MAPTSGARPVAASGRMWFWGRCNGPWDFCAPAGIQAKASKVTIKTAARLLAVCGRSDGVIMVCPLRANLGPMASRRKEPFVETFSRPIDQCIGGKVDCPMEFTNYQWNSVTFVLHAEPPLNPLKTD